MEKINNFEIKPIIFKKKQKKENYFYDLFETHFFNLFCCGKKNSGKSTVIFNIIDKIICNLTTVFIFSMTGENDDAQKLLIEELNENKIGNHIYDSIEHIGEGVEITKKNLQLYKEIWDKSKYYFPIGLFIFDDMPQDHLRNKSLDALIKKNRHLKSIVIISSQNFTDLGRGARINLNYVF